MGLKRGLSPLHDPYNSQAQSEPTKSSVPVNHARYTMDDLLRFYFEHPSSTRKSDNYTPPTSKW